MFTSITYLQSGNDKQQKVYDVFEQTKYYGGFSFI